MYNIYFHHMLLNMIHHFHIINYMIFNIFYLKDLLNFNIAKLLLYYQNEIL